MFTRDDDRSGWTPDPISAGRHGLAEGRRRRDRGVKAASYNTWGPWKRRAEEWLRAASRSRREFVSDDMLEEIGPPIASSKNAVGAAIQGAARRGWIETDGRTVQSVRPSANARRVLVWRGTGGA